jgi:hypothetical protein
MKNDMKAKKALIKEIEGYWGKQFIKTYIPRCHRPLVSPDSYLNAHISSTYILKAPSSSAETKVSAATHALTKTTQRNGSPLSSKPS